MLTEITAATQLVLVCNPNNPTSTHIPAARLAEFLAAVPDHVTVIVDEAYIEFQMNDDPDATLDLRRDFPNLVCLRTFSKVYGLAGLRVGYAVGSAKFRAAVDAVRQPFSVNAIAQAAAAEAIRHGDDVIRRVERTIVERVTVQEGLRDLGLTTPDSHANFSWIDLGDVDEADVVAKLADAGILVRPGAPLGGPGHIRVSYGTPDENRRFLEALADAI
jgi:histidinol-phosphate aminotransferase